VNVGGLTRKENKQHWTCFFFVFFCSYKLTSWFLTMATPDPAVVAENIRKLKEKIIKSGQLIELYQHTDASKFFVNHVINV
jgi:hypothetical protein